MDKNQKEAGTHSHNYADHIMRSTPPEIKAISKPNADISERKRNILHRFTHTQA